IVGTKALREPDWFRSMCEKHPDQLVLGIDARNGLVATDGWLETTDCEATVLAQQFSDIPMAGIVYTDIATDGMLSGPNLKAVCQMQQAVDVPLIASGGVSSLEDIRQLDQIPVAGSIVGKALYEGRLSLSEILTTVG
ncbi:MAG: HisA/HisF-related TIM barrel protein, partial [Planctomycetales bacterium]